MSIMPHGRIRDRAPSKSCIAVRVGQPLIRVILVNLSFSSDPGDVDLVIGVRCISRINFRTF